MMETGIANLGGGSSRQSTEVTKEIRSRQSDLCAVKMQRRKSFLLQPNLQVSPVNGPPCSPVVVLLGAPGEGARYFHPAGVR